MTWMLVTKIEKRKEKRLCLHWCNFVAQFYTEFPIHTVCISAEPTYRHPPVSVDLLPKVSVISWCHRYQMTHFKYVGKVFFNLNHSNLLDNCAVLLLCLQGSTQSLWLLPASLDCMVNLMSCCFQGWALVETRFFTWPRWGWRPRINTAVTTGLIPEHCKDLYEGLLFLYKIISP